jgi:hypothetical protein
VAEVVVGSRTSHPPIIVAVNTIFGVTNARAGHIAEIAEPLTNRKIRKTNIRLVITIPRRTSAFYHQYACCQRERSPTPNYEVVAIRLKLRLRLSVIV